MNEETNHFEDDNTEDNFYSPQQSDEKTTDEDNYQPQDDNDENYGFEDDGEYADNPADSDGLSSNPYQEATSEESSSLSSDFMEENDEEIQATEKEAAERNKNKAPFLNRFRILMVIFGSLFLTIILSVFVIPAFKKDKTEEELLDKRGQVYIPDKITKWEPDKTLVESSPFENNLPSQDNQTMTESEVEELLAGIPYSDESQEQQNTAPVPVQQSTGGGGTISTRPVTNRNEQQKAINRMPLNDTGLAAAVGGAITGYAGGYKSTPADYGRTGLPYSSDSYGQYAQDRMASLMAQVPMTAGYGGANSYQQQNMQSQKQQFQSAGSGNYSMQWNTEYDLNYGTIIPAALITGINTDLPGLVIAQVTSNVYSSLDGKHLLIPAGTRIFATYNSSVSYGQNRVQVAWDKMIRPDGLEIDLGNFTGVDTKGFAGYKGWVNEHPFEYLKALGLIAAFSMLDTKMENIQTNQNNMYTQNMLAETYSEINKLGAKIIDRALDIQPTITIPQGTEVKIITNVTMSLPPVAFNPEVEKYVRK